jgi:hypothetical protein
MLLIHGIDWSTHSMILLVIHDHSIEPNLSGILSISVLSAVYDFLALSNTCVVCDVMDHFIHASNSVFSGACQTLDIYFSLIAGFFRLDAINHSATLFISFCITFLGDCFVASLTAVASAALLAFANSAGSNDLGTCLLNTHCGLPLIFVITVSFIVVRKSVVNQFTLPIGFLTSHFASVAVLSTTLVIHFHTKPIQARSAAVSSQLTKKSVITAVSGLFVFHWS